MTQYNKPKVCLISSKNVKPFIELFASFFLFSVTHIQNYADIFSGFQNFNLFLIFNSLYEIHRALTFVMLPNLMNVTTPFLRYTRTIVDKGNGRYNLLILCWGPGQGSPIHDHSNSDCFVKILSGQLKETLFKLPQGENFFFF